MPEHVEVFGDPVASMHVSSLSSDVQGFDAIVSLEDRDHLDGKLAFVF